MKIIKLLPKLFVLFILISLFSCGSRKDVVYFQDLDPNNINKSIKNYIPTIKPDDMLTINVSSLDQDLARPFNLPAVSFVGADGRVAQPAQQTYLVDGEGNIEFPVLGTIKLGGLNRAQATSLIKNLLKEYFTKPPIVNLRIVNFKVTVLGEVNRPGVYTINNDRLTILEAIGLAGDLRIQAERKSIVIVREEKGKKISQKLDITSEDIFNSPMYYLSQNDVIYVLPNKSRIRSSTVGPNTSLTLSVIGTLITAAALVFNVTRSN